MRPKQVLPLFAYCGLSFSVSQTAAVPAVPPMAEALDISNSAVLWTLSANLAATAVFTPLLGRFGDMFGKRRALLACLLLFAAGSAISALSASLLPLIAGRSIQGAGGGIFPLCFSLIKDGFPPKLVTRSIGIVASILGLASGLGLVIGGLALDHVGWPWVFWIGAIMGTTAAVAVWCLVPEQPASNPGRIQVWTLTMLASSLAAIMIGISTVAEWGAFDPRTLALLVGGAGLLAIWARIEMGRADPLIDLDLFRLPGLPSLSVATVGLGFTLFGSFVVVGQIAQSSPDGLGLSATGAGLLMSPGCVAMLVMGLTVGPIGRRFGPLAPLLLGFLAIAAGLVVIALDLTSFTVVLIGCTLSFSGVGLAMATVPNLVVAAVEPAKTGESTAVNVLMRTGGSAIGSQVVAAVFVAHGPGGIPDHASYVIALLVCAGMAAAAALVVTIAPRGGRLSPEISG